MEETSLTMQTARTIIDRDDKVDRATMKRPERIDAKDVRKEVMRIRARNRSRAALPKAINETLAEGAALIKESKGLGGVDHRATSHSLSLLERQQHDEKRLLLLVIAGREPGDRLPGFGDGSSCLGSREDQFRVVIRQVT
jgi:hypothetical protein